ncbi:putative olfactory receptor 5AK3 [Octodon degus]|uniref:Olfactory receptor 5AK3 n=1 Tax=Octodon degus TaxID=10160 RepID=A0A6P6DP55_OCTDE|nr:putative olfactory receptor 5AK3 [Octodon degus]
MKYWNGTEVTEFYLWGFGGQRQLQPALFTVFLVIYTTSMVGNTGMILLIHTDSRLQTPMYFFLQHLAFVDICYTSAITPKMLQNFVVDDKSVTFGGCLVQLLVYAIFATSDCYILAAMAVDRYVAIWFNLTFTVSVVIFSYICILAAILKMPSAAGRKKTFSTCASHLTAVTIFYGTLSYMYLQPPSEQAQENMKVASVFYGIVIPMLNPLIYSLRNKEVKEAVKMIGKKFFTLGQNC